MSTSIPHTTDTGQPRVISDAERDYQFAVFERMKRAATDPTYRLALLEAYAIRGYETVIPSLVRAIDYLQDNAAAAGELVSA